MLTLGHFNLHLMKTLLLSDWVSVLDSIQIVQKGKPELRQYLEACGLRTDPFCTLHLLSLLNCAHLDHLGGHTAQKMEPVQFCLFLCKCSEEAHEHCAPRHRVRPRLCSSLFAPDQSSRRAQYRAHRRRSRELGETTQILPDCPLFARRGAIVTSIVSMAKGKSIEIMHFKGWQPMYMCS